MNSKHCVWLTQYSTFFLEWEKPCVWVLIVNYILGELFILSFNSSHWVCLVLQRKILINWNWDWTTVQKISNTSFVQKKCKLEVEDREQFEKYSCLLFSFTMCIYKKFIFPSISELFCALKEKDIENQKPFADLLESLFLFCPLWIYTHYQ